MLKKSKLNIIIICNIALFIYIGFIAGQNSNSFKNLFSTTNKKKEDIKNILGIDIAVKRPEIGVITTNEEKNSGIVRKQIIYKPTENMPIRAFVFSPADLSKKYPAVLVLHGHGHGVNDTTITASAYEFARQLAQNGFVTMCFSFGDVEKGLGFNKHNLASRTLLLEGKPLLGVYVKAAIIALDCLSQFDFVDADLIGVAGESWGGHTAVYLAALDKRVKSVVDAAYFKSYRELPLHPEDCTCNYIPGILKNYDFPVIAAMIAPGPALYMVGEKDRSLNIDLVKNYFDSVVVPAYQKNVISYKVKLLVHQGGHEIVIDDSINWFLETLSGKSGNSLHSSAVSSQLKKQTKN